MVRITRQLPDLGISRRFRVESDAADLAPAWAASLREGRTPWCEVSIYPDGFVGSYGGEVWPMAWPTYFEGCPGPAGQRGGVQLTEEGRVVFGLEELDGEEPGAGLWRPPGPRQ